MPGFLSNGLWQTGDSHRNDASGAFVRTRSQFRSRVTADGSNGFKAESNRYLLIVSLACPWAHRTLLMRSLKQLENVIDVSIVDPVSGDAGWEFPDDSGCGIEGLNHLRALHQIYTLANADYSGLVTVPVLWDKHSMRIVNNESSEIIRMLNADFAAYQQRSLDFYPERLRSHIDAVNEYVYERINNGVYRCGFASTQSAYESAAEDLFSALDVLEERLASSRYLVGDQLTEADVRLFPTLVRFDAVYFVHFKCCVRRIADYPNLSGYVRDIYQTEGVAQTVDLGHIKRHYYLSHASLNPGKIIPTGPSFNFLAPHGRASLSRN